MMRDRERQSMHLWMSADYFPDDRVWRVPSLRKDYVPVLAKLSPQASHMRFLFRITA
jgi:hypothetical protein